MQQLDVTERQLLRPLFASNEESMLQSCFAGWFGDAYADDAEHPQIGGIYVADFSMVAGNAEHPQAQELLECVAQRNECILVPLETSWEPVIERHFGTRARRIERYATKKEGDVFDRVHLKELTDSLPPEYVLTPIDEALYHQTLQTEWSRDLCGNFKTYEDFLARGLGVVALYHGIPVGGASSYTSYPGGIEIEIDTQRAHRRHGIASACGAALILAALERGLYPNWDAMTPISLHLAEKLGYHLSYPYTAYVIHQQVISKQGE